MDGPHPSRIEIHLAVYFLPKSRTKTFLARTDLPANVIAIDVSDKAPNGWNVLAASFDHGDLPVPGMPGAVARSVDGIWEALKRFQAEAEDPALLAAPKARKRRATEATGACLGHVYDGKVIPEEAEARRRIYVPAYHWMAKHAPAAKPKFEELVELARTNTLHLYDGTENGDLHDPRALSHAALLAELVAATRKARTAAAAQAALAETPELATV